MYIGKHEYKPSKELLDGVLPRLKALEKQIDEELRVLWEQEKNSCDFSGGITDDYEEQQRRDALRSKQDRLRAKRDIVDQLLRPFYDEARAFWEEEEKKACDRMMAL